VIRIVYVIPTLDQSGAERQLTLLATHLPRDEYEPHVIAFNRGGYYADVLRDSGISVDILEKRFRIDPLTLFRLRSRLKFLRPDIVQSFLFSANTSIRMPGIVPKGSRVIVSERCVDTWKSAWQKTVDRRLAQRMDAMTANSRSVADFYEQEIGVPRNLITVIPNGLSVCNEAGSGKLREELGLSPDCRIVGFVGRLAAQKRLRDLLWGFHLMRQAAEQPVALVLIGDGPERDDLAEFVTDLGSRDFVRFLGHRENAAALIADFDLFCLPSDFEGMSNSLMESMAAGVPCLASDIPANRELVEHEKTGLLFPVGDGPAIARCGLRFLNEPEFTRTIGQAGQLFIRNHHSAESLVQRHCDLYQRLSLPSDNPNSAE